MYFFLEKSILLSDSWIIYNDVVNKIISDSKKLELLTIPERITSLTQLFVVYKFQIWKNFIF